MFRSFRTLVTLAAAVAMVTTVTAQAPIRLKLATFAPANTSWHKALLEMKATVEKSTEARVAIDVFANGTQGPESTVVTYLRVNQLQAALLMPTGLAQIDQSINVFGMPFFIRDDAELKYMLETLGPEVAKRLDAKGFQLVNWGSAGWVQVFSKQPIRTLDELKKSKLYTSAGDDSMVRWYTENGFNPQALNEKEIVTQLRLPNGMINAVPSPPYGALAYQFYTATPYMLEVNVAPLVGATVVNKTTWNRLTPGDKTAVLNAARAMESRVLTDVARVDADSVAAMKKARLNVTVLDAKAKAEFEKAAAALVPTLKGRIVPDDMYDMAVKARTAYRAKAPR